MQWKLCSLCWFSGDKTSTPHSGLYVTAATCAKQHVLNPSTPEWSPRLCAPLPLPPSKLCLFPSKVGMKKPGGGKETTEKGREDRCAGGTLTPKNSRSKTPSLEAKKREHRGQRSWRIPQTSFSFTSSSSFTWSLFLEKYPFLHQHRKKKPHFICLSSPLPTGFLALEWSSVNKLGCLVQTSHQQLFIEHLL